MNSLSLERREYLEKQPWDEIIPRAVLYAARRLEFYEWQGSWKGGPPMGRTAEDFVNDIIAELFQGGGRDWDLNKYPDFLEVLCGMIKSKISNALKSKENRKNICEAALAASRQIPAPLDTLEHPSSSTDEAVLNREKDAENDKWLMSFMGHIQDDSDLMAVLDCKLQGIFKPAEIAQRLGVDSQKMENLQKKWKRRTEDFQKKNKIGPRAKKGDRAHG